MPSTQPGINHIEFWVSDLKTSLAFYEPLFSAIGWRKLGEGEFGSGSSMIYFSEKAVPKVDSAGPRHLCFQATSRDVVDAVGKLLVDSSATILRGPVEMTDYSQGYYTVDFRDPDGYVLEVAHTPNMTL
ncbi:MAG TPA: VOC family protein [Thermoanaerobaculia bacterium]|nr:VOC family protein [Thermoanaerobaculia bacterium]